MSRPPSPTPEAAAKRALKSPLRMAGLPALTVAAPAAGPLPVMQPLGVELGPEQRRDLQIASFTGWLRTQTSRDKRPYQPETIRDYVDPARLLSRWMTERGIEGDFTSCGTTEMNSFFARYRSSHAQTGTNSVQRNMHHLFRWLDKTRGHPDPWADPELMRYSPEKSRPSTLSREFITDLFEVTGGEKAKEFIDVRDYAILRMLCEGPRREEVAQQQVDDLSSDLIASPFVRLVPLKGAREWSSGRLVALSMSTARAITLYLQVRGSHKKASLPALWLGSRNRGPMTGSGLYQMVERRAEQAGYNPQEVWTHMYRHTVSHDWLAGEGSEGDLMRLMGWKSRTMVDRYAEDLQDQRAIEAKLRRGEMY